MVRTESAFVQIVPLVPGIELPRPANAKTREHVPSGYGVQEQCLPFTAASGLGFLIPSPIRFGHCPLEQVPQNCRSFQSPISSERTQAGWVFYVEDNPACQFSRNAYTVNGIPRNEGMLEPGISFFDREDQQALFKLHLPYIWRTQANIDTLFIPLINRKAQAQDVQSGLVETDWYSGPVNMIIRKPEPPLHVARAELIAQAVLISRELRRPMIEPAASHSRLTRDTREAVAAWYDQHVKDRAAYKMLARSRQGRIES